MVGGETGMFQNCRAIAMAYNICYKVNYYISYLQYRTLISHHIERRGKRGVTHSPNDSNGGSRYRYNTL